LQSAEVERERDAFLDKVLYRHGYVPITVAPLNAEERRRAADAMSAFLLVELGAREVDGLIAGRKTLADLGLQASLEDACRRAIGSAIPRLGGTPLSRRVDNILDLAVVGGMM
jgi:hypothetical protein